MSSYWFCPCIACDGQGRLVIQRDIKTGRLFLHCDECLRSWDNPRDVNDRKKCHPDLRENYEEIDLPEIQRMGWGGYAKHLYEK
ncbi:hypothetical protein V8J88_10805 [Massilia sp. W12]|uniref:hypothetical protein n=1 Tax=Massilia sp. W12 TaxID=3126507 RepID=UPI0030D05901